ncbi:MAG: aldo/keto reductase [Campylobacterota bacterium]|nr:aldo/keto reductase [Campylobacterota bacterium]
MKYIDYNNDKLSKLALGTVQFGLNYGIANQNGQVLKTEVNNIINYLYDKKINCFDTAQAYGNAEEVLGKALDNSKNNFIISKLNSELFSNNLIDNLNNSLKNLKIDSLYGLLLHDSELLYNWNNSDSLLVEKLISENKIKYFGVSIYSTKDFELALENNSITFIQIPFNIFDQRAINENWFKKAKEKNKLIFIRSIFLQGLLLLDIKDIPKNLLNAKNYLIKLDNYCKKLNISKSELALNFVDTTATNSIILFGCDNLTQAKSNIETYNNLIKLDTNILNDLKNDFKDIEENIYNPTMW